MAEKIPHIQKIAPARIMVQSLDSFATILIIILLSCWRNVAGSTAKSMNRNRTSNGEMLMICLIVLNVSNRCFSLGDELRFLNEYMNIQKF
jgi:hypothetical protein